MELVLQDLRHAFRVLRRNPGSTVMSVLTLALAIAATTAIFSVVYAVLLKPLPYSDPERIVALFEITPQGEWNRLADPNFDDFRDQSRSFQAIAKYTAYIVSVSGGSEPTRTMVARITPQFLKIFRVQPIVGRDFTPSDAAKGAAPVALVSSGYWTQYLGSSLDFSKLRLKIDNTIYSIIGVIPDGFQFPKEAAVWLPADRDGETSSRTAHNYDGVARLRDGVTVQQANAEISSIARRIHDTSSEQSDYLMKDATVVPLEVSMTGKARSALLILLGAVGFLLLVACANVANLLLAQASVRERELTIRTALGASRGRLIRQFLAESFVLAIVSGALGVLGAFGGVSALIALAPADLPRLESISINTPVLVFAFLLSTAVATGLGIFTALRATSGSLREGLGEGAHQSGSLHRERFGRGIVAAQISITLCLIIGAGLLGRSLMKVLAVDPGFRVDKIIAMDVAFPWVGWSNSSSKATQRVFYANLIDRLKQIPGVRQVGATSALPLDGGLPDGMFLRMSREELPKNPGNDEDVTRQFDLLFQQKERRGNADFGVVTDGYLQTLAIPLLRGRIFDARDTPDSPHVAVISDSLARTAWPVQDPIGHTIEFGNMDGDMRLLTIVGIVGDIHDYGLDAPPRPTVYVDLFQRPRPWMTITMLTDANTQAVTTTARRILAELNPEIPPRFRTFAQIYSASLGSRRFQLLLIGTFAIVALLLATAGVFGVMAYSVSRRTREIGVRVALGARSRDVLTLILSQGMGSIMIGVVIGLAGSLALTRTLSSLLFGVTATDPLTFLAVIALLITAALLACYIPARRATKVDPMVALRYE
jgi:predicted permease